ncbi:MAG: 16S rRNA (uracil(1498)-N(3))-methyltransferase [Leptospirales bacterium]|nr:16S rRNA (uracil(1498)-N(3))-methyltransferase [Leptospirales bacterium]
MNSVPQFFIKESDIDETKATIKGEECHHLINVRRIKIGDILDIRTESGRGFKAEIVNISHSEILLKLLKEIEADQKIIDIALYMSLLKGGNFEFVIRKAAEVGVNRIIPVYSSRTIPEIEKKVEDKLKRWNKIALSASKQCLRDNVPVVEHPINFDHAVKDNGRSIKLAAHPGSESELKNLLALKERPESVSILIGPEGGFTNSELDLASKHGWNIVNFGHTNLRAETAAIIIPSLIIYQWS